MNREKELVKNSAILSIGTILPKLASILTIPIITGCLTKAEYGTYDVITVLVSLFLPVATLQMQAAAFRFLVDERGNEKRQKSIITNIYLFVLPVSIFALFLLFFFLKNIDIVNRILILTYFFVDMLLITSRQVARGLSKNRIYSDSALLNSALELICMFVLLQVLDTGLVGALSALIFSQFVSLLYVFLRVKIIYFIDFNEFSLSEIKKMIAYSWPMIPNSLSSWVMKVSNRLIITANLGVEANAVYAVANKLPNIFSIVQSTFLLAWQENASLSVKDSDSGEYYGKMFQTVTRLLAGIMAILIAFTPVIYKILIRGDYAESYNQMPILYIGMFYSAISAYIGGIYIAHMKSKQIGITTTVAAAVNVIINVLFIKQIGLYAASIATLVSYLLLTIYRMFDIQKVQRIKFNIHEFVILSILLFFMSFICFQRNMFFDICNMVFSVVVCYMFNRNIFSMIVVYMKRLK